VILAGEVTLSEEWGQALANYVQRGGTLVICADQISGRGIASLKLPLMGEAKESDSFEWNGKSFPSNVFRYNPISAEGATVLAKVGNDAAATLSKFGEGHIVLISAPLGLGIDQRPIPILGLLMQRLVQGLMPIKVTGEVEFALNKLDTGGWVVTLFNNRGIIKPQHGILPTEHGESQSVTISTSLPIKSGTEWIAASEVQIKQVDAHSEFKLIVPAGGVRIVEIK
jgi:hypothetical protein